MRSAQRNHTWALSDGQVVARHAGGPHRTAGFVSAARLTDHHDQELADLTGELNTLFMRHLTHGDGRELAVLYTPDGFFLAWVRGQDDTTRDVDAGTDVGSDSDDDAIRDALGLA